MGKKEKHNPTLHMKVDALKSKVDKLEVDVSWLKRGYWIQALLAVGTFLTMLAMGLRFIGVI